MKDAAGAAAGKEPRHRAAGRKTRCAGNNYRKTIGSGGLAKKTPPRPGSRRHVNSAESFAIGRGVQKIIRYARVGFFQLSDFIYFGGLFFGHSPPRASSFLAGVAHCGIANKKASTNYLLFFRGRTWRAFY